MPSLPLPVEQALSRTQIARLVEERQALVLLTFQRLLRKPIDIPKFVGHHETAKFGNLTLEEIARSLLHDHRVGSFETVLGRDYFHPLVLDLCCRRFGDENVIPGERASFTLLSDAATYYVQQNMSDTGYGRLLCSYNSDQNEDEQGYRVRILCRGRKPAQEPCPSHPYWCLYGADSWHFICGDAEAYRVTNNFDQNKDFRDLIHTFLYDIKDATEELVEGWREYGLIEQWEFGERIDVGEWNTLANDQYVQWGDIEE